MNPSNRSPMMTYREVADYCKVSLSQVQKLARAAEMEEEIRARKRDASDVPVGLVRYLGSGFPVPKRVGNVGRLRVEWVDRWLDSRG